MDEHQMTKDEALDLALEALENLFGIPDKWTGEGGGDVAVWRLGGSYRAQQAITAIKQVRSAPVQVFDHVTAARQGLRDAQNRSRLISNLINCGTCGYPLAPEERTSLIERDGVMVKPAPVQEPVACVIDGDLYFHHEIDWEDLAYQGHGVELLYTTPPAAQRTWVGLTDEERMDVLLALNWDKQLTHMDTAKAIEAKLKEKNT